MDSDDELSTLSVQDAAAAAAAADEPSNAAKASGKKHKKKKKKSPADKLLSLNSRCKLFVDAHKGRGIVALSDLAAGTLLFEEDPFCFAALSEQATKETCGVCAQHITSKLACHCHQCNQRFCSQACRESTVHSLECPVYSNLPAIAKESETDISLLRMILRALTICRGVSVSQSGRSAEALDDQFRFPTASAELVFSLVDHLSHNTDEWLAAVRSGAEMLLARSVDLESTSVAPSSSVSADALLKVASIINNNCHASDVTASGAQIVGLYPRVALLNHSCSPNCHYAGINGRCAVRLCRAVKQNEELTVSYTDLLKPRQIRRQALLDEKHFLCECERCVSGVDGGLSDVVCACSDSAVIATNVAVSSEIGSGITEPCKCHKCGAVWAIDNVTERIDAARAMFARADLEYSQRHFKQARSLYEKFVDDFRWEAGRSTPGIYLHRNHESVFTALCRLVNCCNAAADRTAAAAYCQAVVTIQNHVIPRGHLDESAFYLVELADCVKATAPFADGTVLRAKLRKKALQEGVEALQRALAIRKICYGLDHPLTKEVERELLNFLK